MEEEIINVDHLTKDYGFGRGVFNVSIEVHKGECYGYLGPNGAGKSTTIRHIMGFSKPQIGSIHILGMESFGNTDAILGQVGYLPGEVALPEALTGTEFLDMMMGLRNNYDYKQRDRLTKLFKLEPNHPITEMSLGEKRKLAVVAAFMHDPKVLILDEPTSGLDPIMQHVFIDFIKEEKKRGKTILLSSHIFSEVDATCDTISIIKDGVHVSTFNAKELKKRETQTYILHMYDQESFDKALKAIKFDILEKDPDKLKITVEFPRAKYSEFFDSLDGIKIKGFEQKKFTLQDYFMSFYKEERAFSGLKGINGNSKGGRKNGKK